MFGIGGPEVLLIVLVALLVFGPAKIPEVARVVARVYRELTRLRGQVDETVAELRQEMDLTADLPGFAADSAARRPAPLARPPEGQRVASLLEVAEGDDYLTPPESSDPDGYLGLAADSAAVERDYAARAFSAPEAAAQAEPGPGEAER